MSSEELEVIALSLRVAAWAVVFSALPAVIVARILARWRSPLRGLLQGVVMLPLVMPPVVTGYLLLHFLGRTSFLGRFWFELTGSHVAFTTGACVVAAALVAFPLFVESIRLSMVGVDQRLELVSRCLGRGPWQTFWRVTLPLAAPGLIGGAVLCFSRSLGEFGATIIFAGNIEGETRQIPLAVYSLLNVPGAEASVWRLVGLSVALALLAMLTSAWMTNAHSRRMAER
ncbi:MAG: molybdate ABC transporter permease subunit [bacterium]|nr:molybdate ABC transporter permease subunit [Planctomycetota bacterium]HIL50710.1 molybdate ABC transporter permease subunit [Planctomycetota bacterium]